MDRKILTLILLHCLVFADAAEFDTETVLELIQEQLKNVLVNYRDKPDKNCSELDSRHLFSYHGYQTNGTMKKIYSGCDELYEDGYKDSAVYKIWLTHGSRFLPVFCDMETVGAISRKRGWMTIQRRFDGKVHFSKPWAHYVTGFGFIEGEHWMGLTNLERLLKQKHNYVHDTESLALRIDMTDWNDVHGFVEYDAFEMENETKDFAIKVIGDLVGTPELGDPLRKSLGVKFSSDSHGRNCDEQTGGWWIGNCSDINPNGLYAQAHEKMNNSTGYVKGWERINPHNTALKYLSIKLQ